MVYLGKSDKMIKISGKVDKSNTMYFVVMFRSLFLRNNFSSLNKENKLLYPDCELVIQGLLTPQCLTCQTIAQLNRFL